MKVETQQHVMTIKATARNKDRARVWVESDKLAGFGFARGDRINIEIGSDAITVRAVADGKRKVAGRERGGRSIQILDICMPLEQRETLRGGAEQFTVTITPGLITITAEH